MGNHSDPGAHLSRRDVVKASGLASAGALGWAAGVDGNPAEAFAARPELTPRRAAKEIRRHLAGREVAALSNKRTRIFEIDRYLAHHDKGDATIEILRRMERPRRSARAGTGSQAVSYPTDRASAATYWWGYEFRFPHQVMQTINNTIIGRSDQFDALKNVIFLAVEDLEALEPFVDAVTTFVLLYWATLFSIDNRTGKGAGVKATWISPAILIPTKL
jgi:hypothetical protein